MPLAPLAVAALLAGGVASTSHSTPVLGLATCPTGAVGAVIAKKHVCLKRGQQCAKRLDQQYHRYGFHCHTGRLTGGSKPPVSPPAGTIVATIPAPASGGIAIAAGSVWVASTPAHTVTRIDPATNAVVA